VLPFSRLSPFGAFNAVPRACAVGRRAYSSRPSVTVESDQNGAPIRRALGLYRRDVGPSEAIDITFDFRSDTPPGRDPDTRSPTLKKYHKLLWSKPLPTGALFDLDDATPGEYLHHISELGEFFLTSDAVVPSFRREPRLGDILNQIPRAELDEFNRIGYTIGGMMIFPGNRVGRKMTINGARGFHARIKDRSDLTVECIRRHYLDERSPLSATLARYADFFGLFGDFRGYVDFFLLQDIVTEDYSAVRFFTPAQDFAAPPLPGSIDAYKAYKRLAIEFIDARNRRIDGYVDLSVRDP